MDSAYSNPLNWFGKTPGLVPKKGKDIFPCFTIGPVLSYFNALKPRLLYYTAELLVWLESSIELRFVEPLELTFFFLAHFICLYTLFPVLSLALLFVVKTRNISCLNRGGILPLEEEAHFSFFSF